MKCKGRNECGDNAYRFQWEFVFAHDSLSVFCSANSLVAQLYNVYQSYIEKSLR